MTVTSYLPILRYLSPLQVAAWLATALAVCYLVFSVRFEFRLATVAITVDAGLTLRHIQNFLNLLRSPLRQIPGPWWARFTSLGIILEGLKGRRVFGLEKLHHKYGPIIRIGPNEVSIGDWRQLRVIYANSKAALKDSAFYHSATFVGRNNIFQMTNPVEHGARRKMSSSVYALRSITQLDPLIREKAEALVRRLLDEAQTSPNKTADAYKLCGLFSFETICKLAFAKEFDDALADQGALKLLQSMERSAMTLLFDGVIPFLKSTSLGTMLPGAVGEAYRCHKYWEEGSRNMVDHFLAKSSADAKFLLSPISSGVDGFLGRKLHHEELVEEAMGYMFAGSGTTSSTLTYLLYALSLPENTSIQEQLRDEIRNIPANDMNALRQNAFVNAVIKETFRLYPTIISTLPRVLQGPLQIGQNLIPAGTVVGMQNWIHP
ncbi:Cytochrome P450 [Pyrenophora tritici-repentis]|nr:Cytochrome P450 [Pyrenophora tritici-repentis]